MKRKPKVRCVAVEHEVYVGRALIGWVDRMYRKQPRWEAAFIDHHQPSRHYTRAAAVRALVRAWEEGQTCRV